MIPSGARQELARVRSQRETHPGFFRLDLELSPDYPDVLPGQYLNLRVGSRIDPLFRRPFGVVEAKRDRDAMRIELYYAVIGPGTRAMSRWREGDEVDCLGPLGEPYRIDRGRPALLVAGGRGAAPLLFLHRLLEEGGHAEIAFAFGTRSRGLLFGLERLPESRLLLSTEDGSRGSRGRIVEVLERERPQWLREGSVVYACGPERFLAAVAALASRHHLACQVSLEGVYGCGIGLCRGCAVPLVGEERYLMQCVEGPVVDAARVDWERMPHA